VAQSGRAQSKSQRAARAEPASSLPRLGEVPFRRSMQEFLVHKLGAEIIAGVYPQGSVLPSEAEVCARFDVSRTTLREAYSVLSSKSLIVARQKIGTRVRPKSEWNMLDPDVLAWHLETAPTEAFIAELFAFRKMVEPEAAALAAATKDDATIDRVAAAYERMTAASNAGEDVVGPDLEFHMAILNAAGNRFIAALSGLIHAALLATFKVSWEGAAFLREERLLQHGDILQALREHDPERARSLMRKLLRESLEDVRGFFQQAAD